MRHRIGLPLVLASGFIASCYYGAPIQGLPFDGPSTSGSTGDGSSTGTGAGPDGSAPVPSCESPPGPAPLRRLTAAQYDNVIADVFGVEVDVASTLPQDEEVAGFAANSVAPVGELAVEGYLDTAELVGAAAIEQTDWIDCVLEEPACAEATIRDLALQLWRRPPSDDEIDALLDIHAKAGSPVDGLRVVVQTLLQSPSFLYRIELGTDDVSGEAIALSDYEIAARLSFLLWNSIPDDALFEAAAQGELSQPQALQAQVERMLADDRARRSLSEFHRQWLGVTRLPQAHKLSPAFDEVLVDAMLAEVDALSQYVVLEDDGTLETLLTGSFTLASDPMLDVYGPDAMPDPDTDLVDLDPQRRAGVLTLPAVLAAHSHEGESGPVPRGVLIRQNILCQLLPPPPPDVDNIPPPPSPNQTTRERFEQHSSDPVCAGCHAQIDPLGFGFEHYDELGAWRDVDLNGFSVDAGGEILGTDVDRAFDGAVELAQALASSEDVRRCYATQWLRFALARAETEADTCSIDQAYEEFEASDFHVPTLLSALVRTDSFRFRPHSQ